ncbi:unnamed protein product [Amoebophrya sp. A25]|nr:unnamed protein product [Amoebophrya sp. A25]|eukprot:GSA25T00007107001.1
MHLHPPHFDFGDFLGTPSRIFSNTSVSEVDHHLQQCSTTSRQNHNQSDFNDVDVRFLMKREEEGIHLDLEDMGNQHRPLGENSSKIRATTRTGVVRESSSPHHQSSSFLFYQSDPEAEIHVAANEKIGTLENGRVDATSSNNAQVVIEQLETKSASPPSTRWDPRPTSSLLLVDDDEGSLSLQHQDEHNLQEEEQYSTSTRFAFRRRFRVTNHLAKEFFCFREALQAKFGH